MKRKNAMEGEKMAMGSSLRRLGCHMGLEKKVEKERKKCTYGLYSL
jgi:hypothetical protein